MFCMKQVLENGKCVGNPCLDPDVKVVGYRNIIYHEYYSQNAVLFILPFKPRESMKDT